MPDFFGMNPGTTTTFFAPRVERSSLVVKHFTVPLITRIWSSWLKTGFVMQLSKAA
jgi:hypothetical protein